jgi:hypothetical protein
LRSTDAKSQAGEVRTQRAREIKMANELLAKPTSSANPFGLQLRTQSRRSLSKTDSQLVAS